MDKNKVAALPTPESISQEITTVFNELKIRRKHKYMIFKLAADDSGTVEIEKIGESKSTADEFLSGLPSR